MGNATSMMPKMAHIEPNILPPTVVGTKSKSNGIKRAK
jgi:hypothetical protein